MSIKPREIKYIHHYTSIENLALILSNRTIRFSRIDKVDDLKEVDGLPQQFCTYVFISCWTYSDEENIALWKMYTNNMRGARITLPVKMFNEKTSKINVFETIRNKKNIGPFDDAEMITEDYCICNNFREGFDFFDVVKYEDSYNKYYAKAFNLPKKGGLILNPISMIGLFKKKTWSFQKECRFKIYIIPIDQRNLLADLTTRVINSMRNAKEIKFEYFDVNLNREVLDNIVVRKGPLCTTADAVIIDSLIKEYTSNGTIEESSFEGILRK